LQEQFLNYIEKYPLSIVESLSVFIPILIGIIRWAKLTKSLKLVVLFFVIMFIFDIPLWWTAIQRIHNYYWANSQEFICSALFIYIVHTTLERFTKKWFLAILGIYFILSIYDFKWDEYSAIIFAYPRFIFIILSFVFFDELLNKLEIKNLLNYSKFWIFTGLLLSCTGTLLMFVFSRYFSHTKGAELFDKVSMIKDGFKYVYVLLYSAALMLDNKYIDNKL
jgi:hypothetical protein